MTRTELHAKETEAPSALDGAGESANERPQEDTEFVLDDAEAERDWLGRAVLAVGLARRLHRIWRKTNEAGGGEPGARGAFVVHLDAPWGGGKTTFANFLARFLNPDPRPSSVVRELYPIGDVSGLFLDEPPDDPAAATALAKLPEQVRRPWIVVPFNAWQAEHCEPPWWVFYQAIRKGCFDAIWSEGDLAVRPRAPSNRRWRSWGLGLLAWLARPVWPEGLFSVGRPAWPGSPPGLDWPGRAWRWVSRQLAGKVGWVGLVIGEYAWRLFNPKILSLLATALISGGLVYALDRYGLFNVANGGVGFNLDSALGLMFAALTGITAIWGLGAVVTDSIVPGTGSLAERLSLGSGDPFARFRRHFARTMEAVQRPVMVVVDDLDRCRPAFVVDLIRGMQTLLRSPRVVFVILGDRDWIERAFEEHHQAMKAVDVGPEQTFGARFVEKAIQMSFILPALDEDPKLQYVRRVLLGDRAGAPVAPSSDAPPADDEAAAPANSRQEHVAKVAAAKVRQLTHSAASVAGVSVFDTAGIVDMVFDAIDRIEPSKETPVDVRESLKQLNRDQVGQYAGEALAVHTASSGEAERAIVHELQGFAPLFPANPRQIKRIVNAVTVYYSVARERLKENADAAFRAQLTLWIIVMTEWPQTWRLLASCPRLAEVIVADDWEKQLESLGAASPQLLPGSLAATKKEVERVRADSELLALLRGGQRTGARPLEAASVETLAKLTPLHSRKRRLDEPADDPETPEHPARKKRQPRT